MSWKFTNIPKRAICYWGRNQPLSWLRFQTVETFSRLNPEWDILVLTPEYPQQIQPWETGEQSEQYTGKDYWNHIKDLPRVQIKYLNKHPDISEVHRADLARYDALHDTGGVWIDFDIVWLKSMDLLCPSVLLPADLTAAVCWGRHRIKYKPYHSIGFLMGSPGNELWASMLYHATRILKRDQSYQAIGSTMLNTLIGDPTDKPIGQIPFHAVYPVEPKKLQPLLFCRNKSALKLPKDTIGIHWYAGHSDSMALQNSNEDTYLHQLARGEHAI